LGIADAGFVHCFGAVDIGSIPMLLRALLGVLVVKKIIFSSPAFCDWMLTKN
jgi:hypothetical protein